MRKKKGRKNNIFAHRQRAARRPRPHLARAAAAAMAAAGGAAPFGDGPFYDWRAVFPELAPLVAAAPLLAAEVEARGAALAALWAAWPETALYAPDAGDAWDIVPFVYTFPADDPSRTVWVGASCAALPAAAAALRALPGVRTALLSRLGPRTRLTPHQGWAELSNHVLRAHVPLALPRAPRASGVVAGGEACAHELGGALVFDDSVVHSGFNESADEPRTVLIVDVARPPGVRAGVAVGGATRELTSFMEVFRA